MVRSVLVFSLALTFLSSCGTGRSRPRGKQCASDYNPIKVDIQESNVQKISLNPESKEVPAGEYKYLQAELFYSDKTNNLMFHVRNQIDKKTGQTQSSIVCVRGFKQETQLHLNQTTSGMKSMTLDKSGKTTYSIASFVVDFDGYFLRSPLIEDLNDNEKPPTPEKLYQKKGGEFFFYKLSNDGNQFELRSTTNSDSTSLSMLFRYELTSPPLLLFPRSKKPVEAAQ
jgi:hypothetical protein